MKTQIPDWYSDVGPGWTNLLVKLHEGIAATVPDYAVVQVKEKFGTLRVYAARIYDGVEDLIRMAEEESAITCEFCGAPGSLRTEHRWRKTLCDACNTPKGD